jgi:hypothetical protein
MAVGYGLPAVIVALTVTGMNFFITFSKESSFFLFFKSGIQYIKYIG